MYADYVMKRKDRADGVGKLFTWLQENGVDTSAVRVASFKEGLGLEALRDLKVTYTLLLFGVMSWKLISPVTSTANILLCRHVWRLKIADFILHIPQKFTHEVMYIFMCMTTEAHFNVTTTVTL